jgi:heme/copper-type cytochrome/quinol oxidase subunit 2
MDRGRATCGGQKPTAPTTTLIGYSLSINAYYATRRARGLFRHYWVLISLLLTIIATVVLLVETQTISYFADRAADPTTSGDDLRTLGNTLVHSVGGTVVLLVILVLNVYKPRGMTRYGWRKQQEQ